jgi:hypothetical protein
MLFQVLSPIQSTIYGDSFKDAVKNFIKMNHTLSISEMIIKDQSKHWKANIDYYKQDGRNKVGINMFPISPFGLPIIDGSTYVPQQILAPEPMGLLSRFVPMSPLGLSNPSSPSNPFIPMVINIPN